MCEVGPCEGCPICEAFEKRVTVGSVAEGPVLAQVVSKVCNSSQAAGPHTRVELGIRRDKIRECIPGIRVSEKGFQIEGVCSVLPLESFSEGGPLRSD